MANPSKRLDVFEFDEEDEHPPILARTRICSTSLAPLALNKNKVIKNEYYDMERMPALDGEKQINSMDQELLHRVRPNALSGTFCTQLEGSSSPGTVSADENQHLSRESESNDGAVDAVSDTIESMSANIPTSLASPANHDVYESPTENHYNHWEMGENTSIVFNPDLVYYGEAYYTDCVVSFSSSGIEVGGSAVSGNSGTFSTQFSVDDINQIQLEYFTSTDAGQFRIHVISRCPEHSETVHETSEVKELQFYVHDCDLVGKCEAITSLNEYKAVWYSNSVVGDRCKGMEDGKFKPSIKKYFPSYDEPFEEVIYPKGDSDAVSISKRDFDLLQPDTFINDTIIDFYIMYLKTKIQPERKHRYHFFNSFFFRKLADLDKDPSNAFDGRAAFLRVRKWTRKVNLFEKDFVFIPVNYNLHWSLIVICHPGEVANLEDDNFGKLSRVPCILHMDSLRGSHTGLKDLFQSYLWEEWKERLKEFCEDISPQFLNLRFASLELPQQQNLCDCGLFLLHYVECFLEEDPADINPFSITKSSHFLSRDWFHPNEPSCKRGFIQRLIHDLLQSNNCEPSGEDETYFNPLERENNHNQNDIEFSSHPFGGSKSYQEEVLCNLTNQGVEINPLSSSSFSLKDEQCESSSRFHGTESNLQAQIDMHFCSSRSFNEVNNEEDVEGTGEFLYPPASNEAGFGDVGEAVDASEEAVDASEEAFEFPYVCRDENNDVTPATSWKQRISSNAYEQNECEVTVDGKCESDEVEKNSDEDVDKPAASVAAEDATKCFIDSFPSHTVLDITEPQSVASYVPASHHDVLDREENSLTENLSVLVDFAIVDDNDMAQNVAKKIRLMSPAEREVELKALSEDLHL
ncbi:unnamed protein product [Cuscuta europaea]|uniref:Ubiquitin-like protease family profile domain-containing protein n=1 Tax=Cuscuta europaea TaxID=41803 RepID=A0A9P1DWY7_CUSEU|nr:unnamed protein product [Cuscuta europaea]